MFNKYISNFVSFSICLLYVDQTNNYKEVLTEKFGITINS